MGDWDGTARVLEFLWKNIRDSNLEEQLQKACALELLIVLYRAAVTSEADTQPMAVLSLSRIRRLMESNTAEELGNCFYMAVHEIMDAIKMGRTDSAAQAVHMTKSFIDNNLSSDIKLDDVARHVHMSPCYLSRIFSREVGVPFKKYMVKAKLAHARKLLLSTAKSISEIATEVGYQDTSYFCKIFRQDEGLSPNEYRIKHRPKKI
jgi:two-component system response regulator YesN